MEKVYVLGNPWAASENKNCVIAVASSPESAICLAEEHLGKSAVKWGCADKENLSREEATFFLFTKPDACLHASQIGFGTKELDIESVTLDKKYN